MEALGREHGNRWKRRGAEAAKPVSLSCPERPVLNHWPQGEGCPLWWDGPCKLGCQLPLLQCHAPPHPPVNTRTLHPYILSIFSGMTMLFVALAAGRRTELKRIWRRLSRKANMFSEPTIMMTNWRQSYSAWHFNPETETDQQQTESRSSSEPHFTQMCQNVSHSLLGSTDTYKKYSSKSKSTSLRKMQKSNSDFNLRTLRLKSELLFFSGVTIFCTGWTVLLELKYKKPRFEMY